MSKSIVRRKVLVISHDKIGQSMAGPGIRYHHMAQILSEDFDVTVGFFDPSYLPNKPFKRSYKISHIDAHSFEAGFNDFDIVIAHWISEAMINYCNQNKYFLVFDLYVPGPVENLAGSIYGGRLAKTENDFEYNRSLEMYRKFFENGDLFIFSNRRQLDFWTGYFFGSGQVHLSTYMKRPLYDRFISGPFGIDTQTSLKHTDQVLKGVKNGIDKGDKVLLWTGGIWNHFDGQVLMKAMKNLQEKHPDIKLVFLGTQHPNPSIPEMKESLDTRNLAKKLGILNRNVFFNDGWVNYHERLNYFLEADAAINTHKASIETEFSHRTRVLDHILSELPTISTEGDYLSDEIIRPNQLGLLVSPGDVKELEETILKILDPKLNREIRKNIQSCKKQFDWHETMRPLYDYLSDNPIKLELLANGPVPKNRSKTYRTVKKYVPVPVKKVLIRILRIT